MTSEPKKEKRKINSGAQLKIALRAKDLSVAKRVLLDRLGGSDSILLYKHLVTIELEQGDYSAALGTISKIFSIEGKTPSVLMQQGFAKMGSGDYLGAVEAYRESIQIKPTLEAFNNCGIALKRLGFFSEAKESFNDAIALARDIEYSDAYVNLANLEMDLGFYDIAEKTLLGVLANFPNNRVLNNALGVLYDRKLLFREAEECFRKAALSPCVNYLFVWNYALSLQKIRRTKDAYGYFCTAIDLSSQHSELYSDRATCLQALERYEEAEKDYKTAINLNSSNLLAFLNLGILFESQKKYREALEIYDRATAVDNKSIAILGRKIHLLSHLCEWNRLSACVLTLRADTKEYSLPVIPFSLLAISDDPALHKQNAESFCASVAPSCLHYSGVVSTVKTRIKVAYVSSDFREHATSYLIKDLFKLHDRKKFEVVCVSFKSPTNDRITELIRESSDLFIEADSLSDQAIVELMKKLEVDIAVDLKVHTQDNRIGVFCRRAAPIQINWLGFPGTSGCKAFDYIIADKILVREEDYKYFTERVIRLPNSYQVNSSKLIDYDFNSEVTRSEGHFVFACLNSPYKISKEIFNAWLEILQSIDESILLLLVDDSLVKSNLIALAGAFGIHASRLRFLSVTDQRSHLLRYRDVDLFLDTFPCNAHTTASDALYMGVPVVTLSGRSFASRVAASLLSACGLPQLITYSLQEYKDLAINLASNRALLDSIKKFLREGRNTFSLFDTGNFVMSLELAFAEVYRQNKAGQRASFDVSD